MKILLMSHIADPDGLAPVVLANLIFEKVDYLLYETDQFKSEILRLIEENKLTKYDIVYITDLGADEKIYKLIDNDQILKNKIKLFDHHIGNMNANKYSFAKVIDINEQRQKESATSLFYEHLLTEFNNKNINKNSVRQFVNLVREYDTWEWVKTNNLDAKRITNLFDIYGHEHFIKHYTTFLKENDQFYFKEGELFLLEIEQHRIDLYIEEKKEKVISSKIAGYKAGLVFSSKYRSELGNALAEHFKNQYDFIIMIDIERSISYRGSKNVDLNKIAKMFGGKGHKNASGSPLPQNIHEEIIKIIFTNKITINE